MVACRTKIKIQPPVVSPFSASSMGRPVFCRLDYRARSSRGTCTRVAETKERKRECLSVFASIFQAGLSRVEKDQR